MTPRFAPFHGLVLAAGTLLAACNPNATPTAAVTQTRPPALTSGAERTAIAARPAPSAAAIPLAAPSVPTTQSGSSATQALAAFQAGAYDQAVAAAAVAAATAPGDRDGAMMFGRSLLAADRGAEAERVFNGVLADRADDLGALNGMGIAQALQGRFGDAVATLQQARGLAPDDGAVASNLALALFLNGREADAFTLLDGLMARPAPAPRVAVLKAVLASVAQGGLSNGRPNAPDPLLRRVIAMRQK